MQHPVDVRYYDANDPFGSLAGGRRYPHTGSDYAVGTGTTVKHVAPASKVFHTGYNAGNGNYVCVYVRNYDARLGNQGLFVAYLHLSEIHVAPGQEIGEGTIIGLSGNSGSNSNGPHLHVTMSNSELAYLGVGEKIDPYAFIEAERAKPAPVAPKPVTPAKPVAPTKPLTEIEKLRLERAKLNKEIALLKEKNRLNSSQGKRLVKRLAEIVQRLRDLTKPGRKK